jgi:hypothetical protein
LEAERLASDAISEGGEYWGMFGIFKSKEQKSAEKFWKSEMGQRLTAHNTQYFGRGGVWEGCSPEGQQKFCGWLSYRIFGVYQSADPFAAMRLELAAMVACHAELVVLLKTSVNDQIQSRYISGELRRHLRSCVPHCKELAEELWRNPDSSDEDLYLYTQARSVYYNYVLNGINLLRYDFDDFTGGKERDWLGPFDKSMRIWHEDIYRSKIGLPSLFENKVIASLPHSFFSTSCMTGRGIHSLNGNRNGASTSRLADRFLGQPRSVRGQSRSSHSVRSMRSQNVEI